MIDLPLIRNVAADSSDPCKATLALHRSGYVILDRFRAATTAYKRVS